MLSLKRLVATFSAIVALTVLAPVASAGSVRPFHLDKICVEDLSEPLGYVCIVQNSDFKWIPAGTEVHYLSQNEAGDVVQVAIETRNGSTTGVCVWTSPVAAICTFGPGTGRLSRFYLEVVVTTNADQSIWYWDGTYWFGH
ncbi:MAG: hypothetical protein ABI573_12250 [Chloroflexota bacterium]